MFMRSKSLLTFAVFSLSVILSSSTMAEEQADTLLGNDPQKIAQGIGHYERARSLLLAAIREFDAGYKEVRTDQLLDVQKWRETLLQRADELETVLSPNAREIKSGARFDADPRLLGAKVKGKTK